MEKYRKDQLYVCEVRFLDEYGDARGKIYEYFAPRYLIEASWDECGRSTNFVVKTGTTYKAVEIVDIDSVCINTKATKFMSGCLDLDFCGSGILLRPRERALCWDYEYPAEYCLSVPGKNPYQLIEVEVELQEGGTSWFLCHIDAAGKLCNNTHVEVFDEGVMKQGFVKEFCKVGENTTPEDCPAFITKILHCSIEWDKKVLGCSAEEWYDSVHVGNIVDNTFTKDTIKSFDNHVKEKTSMFNNTGMASMNTNKMMDKLFRKADDVVWDLMSGKIGVMKDDSIITAEQDDDLGWITSENMFADFGTSIPAFATAMPLSSVSEGDMVMDSKGVAGWITQKGKSTFKLLKANGQNTKWTPPKTMVNGNAQTVMVVKTIFGDSLTGMQGSLLPMMMMMEEEGTKEEALSSLFPLMMMQGGMIQTEGGNNNMMQTMLMMKAMKGGGEGMSKMLPMMMMQGGGNMFGGGDNQGGMNPMMMAMMMGG